MRGDYGSNRTFMELKWKEEEHTRRTASSNRTFMELKWALLYLPFSAAGSSNRTFMELKSPSAAYDRFCIRF